VANVIACCDVRKIRGPGVRGADDLVVLGAEDRGSRTSVGRGGGGGGGFYLGINARVG